MILAAAFGVLVAAFCAAQAVGNDEVTPPIGWFFVVLAAEMLGAALGHVG